MNRVTKSEFANEIRAKHPGSYDDLSDDKLVELWLKKFPDDKNKISSSSQKKWKYPLWFYFSFILLCCSYFPFIVISNHPGSLYGVVYWPKFVHNTYYWTNLSIIIIALIIYCILNRRKTVNLVAGILNFIFILVLYFKPEFFFVFMPPIDDEISIWEPVANSIMVILSYLLISINLILSIYSISKKQHQ